MPSRGFLITNSGLRSWPSSLNIQLLEGYCQEIFQVFFEVGVGSHCIAQAGDHNPLPQPSKGWDVGHMPLCSAPLKELQVPPVKTCLNLCSHILILKMCPSCASRSCLTVHPQVPCLQNVDNATSLPALRRIKGEHA